jgi:hypothetical protein
MAKRIVQRSAAPVESVRLDCGSRSTFFGDPNIGKGKAKKEQWLRLAETHPAL